MESNLEDEVCPDDMKDKEDGEETIEDVISREHLDHLRSLYRGTEKYPGREESEPGEAPSNNKDAEDDITGGVQLGVVEHLGQLQEYIREVMNNKNQSSTSGKITCP